jgi:UDP-N-acetylglucosamine 4,6-dehydratase
MLQSFDKRIFNLLIIAVLTCITFLWTFWVFHKEPNYEVILSVICVRLLASVFIFKDYSLSWSKATPKTFLLKSVVYIVAFCVYMPFFHGIVRIALFISELFLYLFAINFLMYAYALFINRSRIKKEKSLIIYGAGNAGLTLESEYKNSEYKIRYFIDDDEALQRRSIDGIEIISQLKVKEFAKKKKFDLLIIALPLVDDKNINTLYNNLKNYFYEIKILPPLPSILLDEPLTMQLKDIGVEDLLARYPKDLDKRLTGGFLKDKKVLITGAGGSIGSELSRLCLDYGVQELVLLDNNEYNLYELSEKMSSSKVKFLLQNVLHVNSLEESFAKYTPDIVIHAAAYKHVPLVEENIQEGIRNNIIGTKNCIDLSIKYKAKKFILISTDKAVRPTNVMGATKRVCELYAKNIPSDATEIIAVRFGNVLGSSGSVIPKFKKQIAKGGPLTVTHPEVTRYFMLITEACELVLQSGALGKGGEIFILDMGKPVKIVDLAKKMCELSGKTDIQIKFTGLRAGEKLYEELLINESDEKTKYESITIAKNTFYEIEKLQKDISELLTCKDKLKKLQQIVPEFSHQANC